ncbi:MAG: hypothetical protein IK138_10155 [Lachnospiraceae bacterium]|nr:hypothetical protein [Lachnospiraceae bacterium]
MIKSLLTNTPDVTVTEDGAVENISAPSGAVQEATVPPSIVNVPWELTDTPPPLTEAEQEAIVPPFIINEDVLESLLDNTYTPPPFWALQ